MFRFAVSKFPSFLLRFRFFLSLMDSGCLPKDDLSCKTKKETLHPRIRSGLGKQCVCVSPTWIRGGGGKRFMDFFAGETEVCVFYKCKWRVDNSFSPPKKIVSVEK